MGARINGRVIATGAPGHAPAQGQKRVRSAELRRAVEDVVRAEIAEIASLPMREVIDAAKIRAALGELDVGAVRAAAVAQVAVRVNERVEKRLRKERRSIDDLVSGEVRADIDALLDEGLPNPEALEEILAQVLRQKFVRRLFAELIHSAILAFNKRVNPFFGGLTAAMLDAQIKSFIELGMPMLQEQAVAFALRPANQQFAVDLARSLIRGALAEPLGELVPRASASQRKHIERLVVRVVESDRFRDAAPAVAQRLWDDIYPHLRDVQVGRLIDAERLADTAAPHIAELAVAILARPRVAALLSTILHGRP